jgi:heme/copper-type cytochrome/quinol oxidase subunit 2
LPINTLLSTVILVSFIVTLVLAVGSYLAYKLRDRGRTPTERMEGSDEPVYFERVYPTAVVRPAAAAVERGEQA